MKEWNGEGENEGEHSKQTLEQGGPKVQISYPLKEIRAHTRGKSLRRHGRLSKLESPLRVLEYPVSREELDDTGVSKNQGP